MFFKILHIDEDEADHLLLHRIFQGIFEQFELVWVKNELDFNNKIGSDFRPDLIVLDYVFNGFSVLKTIPLIKLKFPTTDLILLTAFDGPGMEAELQQLGVLEVFKKGDLAKLNNYLLKKVTSAAINYPELIPSKENQIELKFAKIQEALKLAKNKNFLSPLVSFHSHPVMMLNNYLEVVMVNDSGRAFFGELLQIKLDNLPMKIDENAIDKQWINTFKKAFVSNVSLELKIKNTPFQLFLNHQNNADGTTYVMVVGVSWNKLHSTMHSDPFSGNKLQDLFDTESSVIVQFNLEGTIVFASSNITKVVGYNVEELVGRNISDLNAGIFENNFVKNEFQKLELDPNTIRVGQGEMRKKDLQFIKVFYRAKGVLDFNEKLQGFICVFRDITQQINLTQSLLKSKESLKLISANISDLVAVIDQDFCYSYVSLSAQNLVGYTFEELLGKSVFQLVIEEDKQQVKNDFELIAQEVNRGVLDFVFRHRLLKKDGTVVRVESVIKVHKDSQTNALSYIASSRSIEETVQITEQLKQTQLVLKIVSEIQQAYIMGTSLPQSFDNLLIQLQQIFSFDAAYILSFQLDSSEPICMAKWIGKDVSNKLFFEDHLLVENMPKLSLGEMQIYNHGACNTGFESCLAIPVLFDNKLLALLAFGSKMNNLNLPIGEFLNPVSTLISAIITNDRKSKELTITKDKLTKSKSELNAIIGSIDDIIIEVNEDYLVESIWVKNEALLFMPKEQMINKSVAWLAEKINLNEMLLAVSKVFEDGIPYSLEYPSPVDPSQWFYARVNKVKSDLAHFVCIVISDISLKKKAELEIQMALMKEKELAELKTRFVAMTSHEFRTPLANISSSSELMGMVLEKMNIEPSSKVWRYISNIQFGIERMVNLIDDVLFLGKIDAGNMTVNQSEILFSKEVLEILNNLVKINRLPKLPIFQATGVERSLPFDLRILEHIIENLVFNAFKYTCNNSIPRVELLFDNSQIILKVIDYGIGIPVNEQTKLFSQYFRASNVKDIPGTGLGLSIAKKLIELLGCEITVMSKENEGSTFQVIIPYPEEYRLKEQH